MSIRDLHSGTVVSDSGSNRACARHLCVTDIYLVPKVPTEDGRRREKEDSVIKMEALLLYDLMIQRRKLIQL